MKQLNKYKLELIFAVIGAIGGYLYWYYIGCSTGQCPITANWYTSGIYGVVMGFLLGQVVREQIDKRKKTNEV